MPWERYDRIEKPHVCRTPAPWRTRNVKSGSLWRCRKCAQLWALQPIFGDRINRNRVWIRTSDQRTGREH